MTDKPGTNRLVVRPAPGRGTILHPRTFRPLPEEGADVTADRMYFHRMLRTGDVVLVVEPQHPRRKIVTKGE